MAGLAGGLMMVPTNFNDYTHFEELSIKMFALAMAFVIMPYFSDSWCAYLDFLAGGC